MRRRRTGKSSSRDSIRRRCIRGVVGAVLVGSSTFFLAAAAPSSPADAQSSPPVSAPELLANPGFNQGTDHWQITPGGSWAIYSGSSAEGSQYLEWNTGSAGAGSSVFQDVGISSPAGHGYRGSMMLRSPTGAPVSAQLVIFAVNGPSGTISAATTLHFSSRKWQRFLVELDVPSGGNTDLRLQLYLNTPGVNVDVDTASLVDTGLVNASFEQGTANWAVTPGANVTTYAGNAAESSRFLEWNTGTNAQASLFQDLPETPISGHSYQASLLLRSPNSLHVAGQLVLWAANGSSAIEGTTGIRFSYNGWQRFSVGLDVPTSGYTDIRLQLFLNTAWTNLDVDAVSLDDAGLQNASFSQGLTDWQLGKGGMNATTYSGSAYQDDRYLEMNTGNTQFGTVTNSVADHLTAGAAYDAYVALRSPTWKPVEAHVRLYTAGGTGVQQAETDVTVSSARWSLYFVQLDITSSGFTGLHFRVGVITRGVNLDVDAANVLVPHVGATGGGGGGSGCTSNNSCSPATFAAALLAEPAINGPATGPNLYALQIWGRAEGGGAGCPGQPPNSAPWQYSSGPAANPLNTTQRDAGSQPTPWNSVGVQQFQNADGQTCWYWGLLAIYETINSSSYAGIVNVLQHPASSNQQQCDNLGEAVGNSPWGTGYFDRYGDCSISLG